MGSCGSCLDPLICRSVPPCLAHFMRQLAQQMQLDVQCLEGNHDAHAMHQMNIRNKVCSGSESAYRQTPLPSLQFLPSPALSLCRACFKCICDVGAMPIMQDLKGLCVGSSREQTELPTGWVCIAWVGYELCAGVEAGTSIQSLSLG